MMKYEGIKRVKFSKEHEGVVIYCPWVIHEIINLLTSFGVNPDIDTIYELLYLSIRYCRDKRIDAQTYKDLQELKNNDGLYDEVLKRMRRPRSSFYFIYDVPTTVINDDTTYITHRYFIVSVIREYVDNRRRCRVRVTEITDFDGARIGRIISR
jgi:hypothetical protein